MHARAEIVAQRAISAHQRAELELGLDAQQLEVQRAAAFEPQALHVCRSFLGKPAENLALYTYPAYFSKLTMYCTLTEGSAGA